MAKVAELIPGDLVSNAGLQAVFIATTVHPLWPELELVVWRCIDHPAGLEWSHDALSRFQDVGTVVPTNPYDRIKRLHAALVGEQ